MDFISDLIGGATDLLGGVGQLWGGPQAGGLLGLGAKIFGGTEDDPWGLLDSPVFGHIVGAVGVELLRDDPKDIAQAQKDLILAREEAEARRIQSNYAGGETSGIYTPKKRRGLPTPMQPTAVKYLPEGRLV